MNQEEFEKNQSENEKTTKPLDGLNQESKHSETQPSSVGTTYEAFKEKMQQGSAEASGKQTQGQDKAAVSQPGDARTEYLKKVANEKNLKNKSSNYQGYGYNYQARMQTQKRGDGNQIPPHTGNGNIYSSKIPQKPLETRKNGIWGRIIALALVCALVGGGIAGGGVYYYMRHANGNTVTQNIKIDDSYNSDIEAVAAKDLTSIVGIVISGTQSSFGNSIFGFYEGGNNQNAEQTVSQGSGIVYKNNGYIITNYHVVSSAISNSNYKVTVYFNNSNTDSNETSKGYEAKVVGYDASVDLAVIKINANGLTPIDIGSSQNLKIGQKAIAIGNPGGMDFMGSVSEGIISGLNRSLTMESGAKLSLIQTDAAINPGNSGGALVDGTGKLIGICSAKLASENYEGMGFAIPVDNVVNIVDNLIANEGKKSPYLGVTLSTRYNSSTLQQMGYPSGVVVASVADNSPAAQAGIKAGDIITKINNTEVPSYDILKSELNKYNVGDTISIEIYRFNQTTTVQVTLGETSTQ